MLKSWKRTLGFALIVVAFSCTHEKSTLGEQYFNDGEYEKAIEEYTKVIKIKPRSIEVIYNRGRAFQELDREAEAIADFEQVLKLNPDHVQARLSLGNIDFKLGDYERAYYQFNKVVEKFNQNSDAFMYRGKASFRLGNVSEALSDYGDAIRLNPQNGQAYLYRGIIYVQTKRKKSGCADFIKAQSLEVPDAETALRKYCGKK